MPSREDLKYFQAMPLDIKVAMTKTRIREWVKVWGTDGVYVSFSGGKDSTVLLHIVRELYPSIEAVFVDTGGCERTGCMFCGFGCHLEKESRWLRLKKTHPRQYEYCIGGGEYNDDGIWQPNSKGLGLGHCFDVLNEIYGKGFIKYKENEYDKL